MPRCSAPRRSSLVVLPLPIVRAGPGKAGPIKGKPADYFRGTEDMPVAERRASVEDTLFDRADTAPKSMTRLTSERRRGRIPQHVTSEVSPAEAESGRTKRLGEAKAESRATPGSNRPAQASSPVFAHCM